jgi:hypothetical protein
MRGIPALHVLEDQHDPATIALVVRPEQPWGGSGRWESSGNPSLPSVDLRRVFIRLRADGFDEDATIVWRPDAGRYRRREPTGLRRSRNHGCAQPSFQGGEKAWRERRPGQPLSGGRRRLVAHAPR